VLARVEAEQIITPYLEPEFILTSYLGCMTERLSALYQGACLGREHSPRLRFYNYSHFSITITFHNIGLLLSLPLISMWMQGNHQLDLIHKCSLLLNASLISSFLCTQVWFDNLGASQFLWQYVTRVIILPLIRNAQTQVLQGILSVASAFYVCCDINHVYLCSSHCQNWYISLSISVL
jgi:hypothetical protein